MIELLTYRLKYYEQVEKIEEVKDESIYREFRRDEKYRQYRQMSLTYRFIFLAILLLFAVSTYVLVTMAQGNSEPDQSATHGGVAALGDFGMIASPKDSRSDKVAVAIDFIALTNAPPQGTEEVGIGTGNGSDAEMEEVKADPADRVKITQLSRKLARLTVPASSIPTLSVLGALNDPQMKIEKVSVTDSLQAALNDKGNLVRLDYVLTKAQETKDYFGSWLHRFPFDYKTIRVPVKFQQAAIVSKVEVPRQSNDFTAVVSAKGAYGAEFKERDDRYLLDLGKPESRITIPAGGEIQLEATLRRTWFQRLFLTIGQIILAVVGGWFLGFVASLGSESRAATIIGGIGLVGLPYLMRSSVFSTYKDLPNLLSGQGPTIFELVFLLSLVIFVYTAWNTRKKRGIKKRTSI